jgi:hypothetical protein
MPVWMPSWLFGILAILFGFAFWFGAALLVLRWLWP